MADHVNEYLDACRIRYITISHSPAYTERELRSAVRVHGTQMTKAEMIRVDGELVMAVLPAPHVVDLKRLRDLVGALSVDHAPIEVYRDLIGGWAADALPPFGNLCGIDIYVARELAYESTIVFHSGTLNELVCMSYSDYQHLVRPKVIAFSAGPVPDSSRQVSFACEMLDRTNRFALPIVPTS
jgi:Ala-tRNA(Pro) deacylase